MFYNSTMKILQFFLEFNGIVGRIYNLTMANLDYLSLEESSWVQQFRAAMNVNGGDLETATFLDYILHFATFFWKVRINIILEYRVLLL